jgi:hypothetical protein
MWARKLRLPDCPMWTNWGELLVQTILNTVRGSMILSVDIAHLVSENAHAFGKKYSSPEIDRGLASEHSFRECQRGSVR